MALFDPVRNLVGEWEWYGSLREEFAFDPSFAGSLRVIGRRILKLAVRLMVVFIALATIMFVILRFFG